MLPLLTIKHVLIYTKSTVLRRGMDKNLGAAAKRANCFDPS